MLKLGLTGGIGSGKTTVAKIFELLGVPVYYADDAARRLMQHDEDLRLQLTRAFGETIFINNTLDRKQLADLVFNDEKKLKLLNALVHPATITDANRWVQQQQAPYIIKEAALIFESDAYKHLDAVIGVSTPFQLRLQRTMERDHTTAEWVMARMNKQMDEDEKMNRCQYLVKNDEVQMLIPQVLQLHDTFLSLSRQQV